MVRIASVGVAQRSLVGGASRALREITRQARAQAGAQDASLVVLRDGVRMGALQVWPHLVEGRAAMVVLCSNTNG